jgi:ADP-ribosylglycohydrolase
LFRAEKGQIFVKETGMPAMTHDASAPLQRALLSLDGLSVGDSFGERYFGDTRNTLRRVRERELAPAPWRYTDDTEMALSVVEVLKAYGRIDQEALAAAFARRVDEGRGYGPSTLGILSFLRQGLPWRPLSYSAMGGTGSLGNGAAMRVAPVGAFFADDLALAVEQARLSAEVTHAHPEGIAGAIAVAVAAAVAWRNRDRQAPGRDFLEAVLEQVPRGVTRDAISRALDVSPAVEPLAAAAALGNGSEVTAPDTVPFCLWVVARGGSFEESLWSTVAALGDRDTTCAIAGGITAMRAGRDAIPAAWLASREMLPAL